MNTTFALNNLNLEFLITKLNPSSPPHKFANCNIKNIAGSTKWHKAMPTPILQAGLCRPLPSIVAKRPTRPAVPIPLPVESVSNLNAIAAIGPMIIEVITSGTMIRG